MDLIETNPSNAHRHPWEISRADSILRLLPFSLEGLRCADIGAGDQYFAKRLSTLTRQSVYAIDAHYPSSGDTNSIYQRQRVSDIPSQQLDLIFLMDVIEHVEDDSRF